MSRTLIGRKPLKGRGALSNPAGRFERRNLEEADDGWYADEQPDSVATTVEPDRARSIITANGVVSHNCCARPSHGYLGLSAGVDFETRLFYKADAGKLLEQELARPGYVCKPIAIGANTDPYQPVERDLRVTRDPLEVLARTRHPLTMILNGLPGPAGSVRTTSISG